MTDKYSTVKVRNLNVIILFFLFIFSGCCKKDDCCCDQPSKISENKEFKTKNVFIVVADGLRYSESWGEPNCQYIPKMAGELAKQGVVNTTFYNLGDTYTTAGHSNLTTANYQTINNLGMEYPLNPSIFQLWIRQTANKPIKSWVIASKDKLAILGNCNDPLWLGKFTPSVNTGIDGLGIGSGFRDDSLTYQTAIHILKINHPNLVLINFMEPDLSGHSGDWNNYLKGTRKTDEYIYRLWQFLQNDSIYKNTTTIFITSDHGRHLDNVLDGFPSHGDGCEGCRHISFLAMGPDFKKGSMIAVPREQIDIPVTIAKLMGFSIPITRGNVMTELFETDITR